MVISNVLSAHASGVMSGRRILKWLASKWLILQGAVCHEQPLDTDDLLEFLRQYDWFVDN